MKMLQTAPCLPRYYFCSVFGFFTAFILFFGQLPVLEAQTLAVVENNTPKVCIDFSKELVESLKLGPSVEEFVGYVRQMTGVILPLAAEPMGRNLIPMRLDYSGPVNDKWNTDLVQGYEIRIGQDRIVVSAHSRLGFQNALYALLDQWGCRWVMIGKLGEVIPKHTELMLPIGTIKSPNCWNVSLEKRSGGSQEVTNWWNRNQGGSGYRITGQHYWFYAIPPDTYFKDHPEWYSLIGGKRVPRQLCTSNPEVIAKMIEVAKEYLKARPTCLSFPMDPDDNVDFCQCERCRAMDPPGVDEHGRPFVTDRVVHFANEVAKGIAKDYPDRMVAFYAYNNHTEPPVRVKPEKNVTVGITRSNYCLLHLMPRENCPESNEFYELVGKWSKVCSKIWVYEYDPISWTGCLPCPIYMERAASISLLSKKYGVIGGVTDYVPHLTKSYASTYINAYMERRAKMNPDLTPDEILDDMCQSFFGPAAEPMEKYYRELAKVTEYDHPQRSGVRFGTYKYDELFNRKMVNTARTFLNQAIKMSAGKSPYKERIQLVDWSQQYLENYLEGIWAAQSGSYSKSIAAFDRLDEVIQKLVQADAIDITEAKNRILLTAKLSALAQYFPEQMGFIQTWRLLGPFNNDQRDADVRTDPFEPIVSIDHPVTMPDGSVVQWHDYRSSEGKLLIGKAFENANKTFPWKLSYGYAGVNIESETSQKVQFCVHSFYPFKVYLNGKEIFYRPGANAECPDKRVVPVQLKTGKNTVVFKLCQTSFGTPWGVYFRIKDMQGRLMKLKKGRL